MNPLDQLRDIHQPPPPPWWPPGPGWWLLVVLILCMLLAAGWWSYRRYRQRAYRRSALVELAQLAARGEEYDIQALLALVRRTARAGNTESPWPALPAAALLERLDQSSGGRLSQALQTEGTSLAELAQDQYRPEGSEQLAKGSVLRQWCAWWIRHHRQEDLC